MAQNNNLKTELFTQNITLKELSKKTGISRLRLYLYENGYVSIKDKDIQTLSRVLNVDKSLFDIGNGYPVFENDRTNNTKIKKVLGSKTTGVTSAIVVLSSIVFVILGINGINNVKSDTTSYFDKEYINAVNYVRENGSISINLFNPTELLSTVKYKDTTNNSYFTFKVSNDDSFIGKSELSTTLTRSNGYKVGLYYFDNIKGKISIKDTTDTTIYRGNFTRSAKDSISIYNLFSVNDEDESISTPLAELNPVFIDISSFLTNSLVQFDEVFESWNKDTLKYSGSFYDLLSIFKKGNDNLSFYYDLSFQGALLGSTFGAISLMAFVLFAMIFISDRKKKMANSAINVEETVTNNNFCEFKETPLKFRAPLKDNLIYAPFVPEMVFRILGLIFVLIGSTGLMISVGSVLGIFQNIDAVSGFKYNSAVSHILVLGFFTMFFTKLNTIQNKKDMLSSTLLMFGGGLILYIFEVLLSFDLVSTNSVLGLVITELLPGNIIWGIGIFELLNYFLYCNPDWIQGNKTKTIIFRSLSILPLAYCLVSLFYNAGIKLWNFPTLHYAVSALLFSKAFIFISFGILYSYIIYIYRFIVIKKYGKDNASLYFLGNKYFFIKNIIAVVLIIGIGLLEYFGSDLSFAKAFGIKNNWYILALIPIVLFYHPHNGARNKTIELTYSILNMLFLSVSYLFIICILFF